MQTNLLTDVDGVLLDWATAFRKWAAEQLGPLPPSDVTDPNYAHQWIGMSFEEGHQFIQRFQHSEHLRDIPAYQDALEQLPALQRAGYRIIAISGCGTNPTTVDNRWHNLRTVFGDIFSDFIPLFYLQTKKDALARYARGVWVEDAPYHALSGHELGHRTFFMHRNLHPVPDNAPYEPVTDWHCVFNRLVDPTASCC